MSAKDREPQGHDVAPRFTIEQVVLAGGQAFVLASRVDYGPSLALGATATLGGIRVLECLDLPMDLEGMPSRHEDRMVFCLADPADAPRLPRKAVVSLVGARVRA